MDIETVAQKILDGDRRALARAITLVESGRADHREEARALLAEAGPARRLSADRAYDADALRSERRGDRTQLRV